MDPYGPICIPIVPRAQGPWGAHVDAIDKYGRWAKNTEDEQKIWKMSNKNKLTDKNMLSDKHQNIIQAQNY